jgi:hypothetical protein
VVKASLTGLTPAQQRLLGSLNPQTVAAGIATKDLPKVKGLYHALEQIKDRAGTNATYVGAYAHRALVKSKANPNGTMTNSEFCKEFGISEPRGIQLGRSAQIAFDLEVSPTEELWAITSSVQNSPAFTEARKAGLTREAVEKVWAESKTPSTKSKGTKAVQSSAGKDATGDKRSAQEAKTGDLTPNGQAIRDALEAVRKVGTLTAEDWAGLLELRNLIQAKGEASTPEIRRAGQALHGRVNRSKAGK